MMLEIDGWKVNIKFAAAHFIPSHHKCSRLHGHDYGIKMRIYGVEKDGILYDFVALKREVRGICDSLDHHILIPRRSEKIKVEEKGENVEVRFGGKFYSIPKGDVAFIDADIPSAEELAKYIGGEVIKKVKFPSNVRGFELCVEEGPGQGACEYFELEGER